MNYFNITSYLNEYEMYETSVHELEHTGGSHITDSGFMNTVLYVQSNTGDMLSKSHIIRYLVWRQWCIMNFFQQNEGEGLFESHLAIIVGMRALMCLICLAYFYSIGEPTFGIRKSTSYKDLAKDECKKDI